MRSAEKLIHNEFAAVLHITPEEVPSYIAEKLQKTAASQQFS